MIKPPTIPLPLLMRAVDALKKVCVPESQLPPGVFIEAVRSRNELEYYVNAIASYTNVETTPQ